MQEALDSENKDEYMEACSEQYQNAVAFWKKMQCQAPEAEVKKDKRERKKAISWLLGLDKMLQVMTGQGLARFQQEADLAQRAHPSTWPILTVATDQGSDGWSASYYLLFQMSLGMLLLRDTSHRIW